MPNNDSMSLLFCSTDGESIQGLCRFPYCLLMRAQEGAWAIGLTKEVSEGHGQYQIRD
ncbi:MAG: hypothetical protein FWH28_03460 [Clostridiales bacterium]|nr:hypothetical protein [Clostridiales bacterium]